MKPCSVSQQRRTWTAFEVEFDIPSEDDAYNELVGNTFYIDACIG